MPRTDKTLIQRFEDKYIPEPNTGCWLWTAYLSPAGYGKFNIDGIANAHNAAYRLLVGSIPDGIEIDHLCRNRWCVNPQHLEAVPHRINMARGYWATKKTCPYGHLYDEENTYSPPGRVQRVCRICAKAKDMFGHSRVVKLTHCHRGHPYDQENTYVSPQNRRYCRKCGIINTRNYFATRGQASIGQVQ